MKNVMHHTVSIKYKSQQAKHKDKEKTIHKIYKSSNVDKGCYASQSKYKYNFIIHLEAEHSSIVGHISSGIFYIEWGNQIAYHKDSNSHPHIFPSYKSPMTPLT